MKQLLPERVDGVAIYVLAAPHSRVAKYVGATARPRARLACHLSAARRGSGAKNQWIRGLIERGRSPVMRVLRVVDEAMAGQAERAEIEARRGAVLNARGLRPRRAAGATPDGPRVLRVQLTEKAERALDSYLADLAKRDIVPPKIGHTGLILVVAGLQSLGYEVAS